MVGDDDAPWEKGPPASPARPRTDAGRRAPDAFRTAGGSRRPTGLTNPGLGSPYPTNPGSRGPTGATNPGASVELDIDFGRKRSTPAQASPSSLSRTGSMKPLPDPPGDLPGAHLQEDRERRRAVTKRAREFLIHIDTLGRLLAIHEPGNSAVQTVLKNLVDDVLELQKDGDDLKLVFAEGHAFVNGVWVRASKRAWEAARMLTERLADVQGRGLVLEPGTQASTLLALTRFLRTPPPEGVSGADHFANAGLPGIKLVPIPSQADRARAGSNESRDNALDLFREGLETVTRAELANLDLYMRRRQRSLVQSLIQLAENNPEELLSLTVIREPTVAPKAHNLMVCIYSVALGRLMDLSRRDLLRLGMAALNHNLGESLMPEDLFTPERELQDFERQQVEQHPLLGMAHMLKHYGFGMASVERAIASVEHHMRYDGEGGYPFESDRKPHFFARVIAVADVFDALCSPRPWRPAWPPDQAVKLVNRESSKQLDPVIVRRLLWLVGRYPPGSLVELDTGEWALVIGPGRGAYPLVRPRVLLISDEEGWEVPTPIVVDLGERHPRRRAWLRTIARTRDPHKLGLKVHTFFFTDRLESRPGRLDVDEMNE